MADMGKTYPVPKARIVEPASSPRSEREAAAFVLGLDLKDKRTENKLRQLGRDDSLDRHLHIGLILILYVGLTLSLLSVIFLFLHMTNVMRWMSDTQIRTMTELLTTGAIGGVIATVARARFAAIDRKEG